MRIFLLTVMIAALAWAVSAAADPDQYPLWPTGRHPVHAVRLVRTGYLASASVLCACQRPTSDAFAIYLPTVG